MGTDVQPTWPPASARWTIWVAYVLSWSLALEVPQPIKVGEDARLADAVFTISKLAHLSAYALLAGLTGWLQLRGGWRVAALFFLLAHGILTEVLQAVLPFGRHGAFADVLLDWTGIAVGIALTWRWWRGPAKAAGSI